MFVALSPVLPLSRNSFHELAGAWRRSKVEHDVLACLRTMVLPRKRIDFMRNHLRLDIHQQASHLASMARAELNLNSRTRAVGRVDSECADDDSVEGVIRATTRRPQPPQRAKP